ncbi:transcriptional Coactivator p15 [Mariannaea sp. PMI_226]|nr:transcriptional Coactivator p15 [Mariannaea sp. PMI_226]
MPNYSKKRRASVVEDLDSAGEEASPKVSKKVKGSSSLGPDGKDSDGNPFWELSNKRRVGISQFKKMSYINIREYYEKDGKTLPGKKGISLSVEQYTTLLKAIPAINSALRDLGHSVEDPENGSLTALVSTDKATKEKSKSSKANIETTSDEDDE